MGFSHTWLYLLPKRTLTAVVGGLARRPISRFFIPVYVRLYGIDTSDAELHISEYPSLAAFFSRKLKAGARVVGDKEVYVVAPVDGTVQGFGFIKDGELLQAKGSYYSLAALLGSEEDALKLRDGQYVTLYLSPRDYHRIHMPLTGELTYWRYIPGTLFPVNRSGVRNIKGLFTKNERLITFVQTSSGAFALVKIGATVVGSIRTGYGPRHPGVFSKSRRSLSEGTISIHHDVGEEVGYFEFGSTVTVVFSPSIPIKWDLHEGQFIHMGEQMGELV